MAYQLDAKVGEDTHCGAQKTNCIRSATYSASSKVKRYLTKSNSYLLPTLNKHFTIARNHTTGQCEARLTIPVNNQTLGGDPAPGTKKQLTVETSINGKMHKNSAQEGQTFDMTWVLNDAHACAPIAAPPVRQAPQQKPSIKPAVVHTQPAVTPHVTLTLNGKDVQPGTPECAAAIKAMEETLAKDQARWEKGNNFESKDYIDIDESWELLGKIQDQEFNIQNAKMFCNQTSHPTAPPVQNTAVEKQAIRTAAPTMQRPSVALAPAPAQSASQTPQTQPAVTITDAQGKTIHPGTPECTADIKKLETQLQSNEARWKKDNQDDSLSIDESWKLLSEIDDQKYGLEQVKQYCNH
jgi:hypothetical protein